MLSCALLVLVAGMFLLERRAPARPFAKVRGWWPRALLANAAQLAAVFALGATLDPWLWQRRPWSLESLGLVGALLGFVVHAFVYYWWHRARHRSPWLWRWVHQLHHSPSRLELITSFYKHPLEIILNALLSSSVLYLAVGLSAEQAAQAMMLAGLAELFYHWNVRTPFWVGYLLQRPESHCVHHEEGHHHHNYGDLPIFDILFGTFHNPRTFRGRCGLGPGQEQRLWSLLLGRDLS